MPILFNCSCGKRIKAGDQLQGKKCKCPQCGQLLTVPPSETKAADAGVFALAAEDGQPCPECGQRLKPGANTCTRCGFDFRLGRKVNEQPSVRVCSVCEAPLDPGMDECPYCQTAGMAIEEHHRTEAAAENKRAGEKAKRSGRRSAPESEKTVLTRKTPVADKKLPGPAEMGELLREYRVSTANSVINMVLGGIAVVVGLFLIIFFVSAPSDDKKQELFRTTVREGPFEKTTIQYGDGGGFNACKLFTILVGLAVTGAGGGLLYRAFATRGLVIQLYKDGLVEVRGSLQQVFPWERIVRFEHEKAKKSLQQGIITSPVEITLERADGRTLVLDGSLQGISVLGEKLKKELSNYLSPAASES